MPLDQLTDFVTRAEVPPHVRERAAAALLDAATCAIAAASCGDRTVEILLRQALDQGGTPESGVLTQPLQFPAQNAARINAAAIHALDFDDTTLTSWIGHPSAVLYGALLAVGSRELSHIGEMLEAWAIGFEVGARLGEAGGAEAYARGWHNTATIGAVAAAAAIARLLRYTAEQTGAALNIAAALSSGLKVAFGSDVKPFQVGQAAANAVLAADLAAHGLQAASDMLYAPNGWLEALGVPAQSGRPRLLSAVRDLGQRWDAVEGGLADKLWPCCAYTHWAIEAALTLREQIEDSDRVTAITLHASETARATCRHHHPVHPSDARFSLPGTVSLALTVGWPTADHFLAESLPADAVRLLRRHRYAAPVPDLPDWGGRLVVELEDGARLTETVATPLGHPQRPLTPSDRETKFRAAIAPLRERDRTPPEWSALTDLSTAPDARVDALLTATHIG